MRRFHGIYLSPSMPCNSPGSTACASPTEIVPGPTRQASLRRPACARGGHRGLHLGLDRVALALTRSRPAFVCGLEKACGWAFQSCQLEPDPPHRDARKVHFSSRGTGSRRCAAWVPTLCAAVFRLHLLMLGLAGDVPTATRRCTP